MKKCSKRIMGASIALLLGLGICSGGLAENLDITQLSYDELSSLRDEIDLRMEDIKRQYAIENGNRVIQLDYERVTLFEKERQKVVPEVTRVVEDAPENTSFVWSTSDESVATVAANGSITAIAEGSAVITCTAEDDQYIFASVPVNVVKRVSGITMSEEALTLRISEKQAGLREGDLSVSILPESAYCQDVTWSSSNEEAVAVDDAGHIVAVNPGTATITATSNEEVTGEQKPKKSSCKVTVVKDVASVELDQMEMKVKKGSTAKLVATIAPEDASNKKLEWESSDTEIATVQNGQITAKSCGTCVITCRASDDSGEFAACNVTVYQPVTGIKLDQTSVTAYIGVDPVHVGSSVSPEDATDKTLEWTSSDPSVARVDQDGNITAVAGGTCKVTCAACDGSEKNAEISVFVPSISVEKTEWMVTDKDGMSIPVQFFGKDIADLSIVVGSRNILSAGLVMGETPEIKIMPNKAGTTKITLKDKQNEKSIITLNMTVDHSAVYDSTSYPVASYEKILRNPVDYFWDNIQIYGKVLQKIKSGSYVALRVGTTGRYYDSVFYVVYSEDNIDARVIEDDYVTIYGTCTGTETYETTLGRKITIPSMRAQKIVIGKKK